MSLSERVWSWVGDRIRAATVRPESTLSDPAAWLDTGSGAAALAGMDVSETTALNISTVCACVRMLAGLFASLPGHVVRDSENGSERAYEHSLYPFIHDEANRELDVYHYREAQWVNELLWGNSYSFVEWGGNGQVSGLWHMTSDRVTPYRDDETRKILYDVTADSGPVQTLEASQVLHVAGLGYDGLVGKSPVALYREALGLALVTEQHGSRFFGQGARPGLTITHPGRLTPTAVAAIKAMWNSDHRGSTAAHGVSVLPEGMGISLHSIPNEDAQFLGTRAFQVVEIASRMFGIPPWMVGESSNASNWGTGLEQQAIGFVVYSLMPRIRRREAAENRALLSSSDRASGYRITYDLRGLMRGDGQARINYYHSALTDGWLTRNEVRNLEDMNPAPGLDEFLVPSGGPTPRPQGEQARLRDSFRALYREAWSSILSRAVQDSVRTDDRWRSELTAYATRRLNPINDAWQSAGGRPSWVPWVDVMPGHGDDVNRAAHDAAEESLGRLED